MEDILFSSATVLARAIRAKQVSAMELLDARLAHIAKYNPALNAIVTIDQVMNWRIPYENRILSTCASTAFLPPHFW